MLRLVLLLILFSMPAKAEVLLYFTPSLDCENKIIELIDNSTTSIDIVMYALNNKNIVDALKKAHKKGVDIKILADKLQASNKYSKIKELYNYGINVMINTQYKIQHNKFAIFDKTIATSGSYNWTNSASNKNAENCLFFINNKTSQRYYKKFMFLWQNNDDKKSNQWLIKKIKLN